MLFACSSKLSTWEVPPQMIRGSGQGTIHSGSHGPFALFPPCTLAEESVLMEPDGS